MEGPQEKGKAGVLEDGQASPHRPAGYSLRQIGEREGAPLLLAVRACWKLALTFRSGVDYSDLRSQSLPNVFRPRALLPLP